MRRAAGYSNFALEVASAPAVPNLPGHHLLHSQDHPKRKSTTLMFKNNKPVVLDPPVKADDPSDLSRFNLLPGMEPALLSKPDPPPEATLQGSRRMEATQWNGAKTPGWLLYGNKVLRFFAYLVESVENNALEDVRVRKLQIRYYLDDDTMEIIEPPEPNSGLPHGKFLHRHKVKLANKSTLTWQHLRVGASITIYCHQIHIIGCDGATRQFFTEQQMLQEPNRDYPDGPYDLNKKERELRDQAARSPRRGPRGPDDPFEEHAGPNAMFAIFQDGKQLDSLGRQVLRFFCCWDNTQQVFGQKLPFALHYYLIDNTIEVVEMHRRNDGRDPFPLLLKRGPLPKTVPPVDGRPMSPRTKARTHHVEFYQWQDLRIGGIVKVYNRDLLIYDCDAFTRKWYQQHLGLPDAAFKPIEVDFDMSVKRPELVIPPDQLGVGSEEDSRRNVLDLVPKRPKRDYFEYMENVNKVLRFSAQMVPVPGHGLVGPYDADRRFVVKYHVLDKALSIWEMKQPNSGIKGGTFLERTQVKKHNSSDLITDADLYVGAVLLIFSRGFELQDADNFTLKLMELEPDKYPYACYDLVLAKVKGMLQQHPQLQEQLRAQLLMQDAKGTGYISKTQLHAVLRQAGIDVTLHEAITLVRQLGADRQGVVIEQLLGAVGLLEEQQWQQHPSTAALSPQVPQQASQQAYMAPKQVLPQQMPAQQVPSHQMPPQQIPAQQVPSHQMPPQQIPAQQVPSQQMPAQQVPSHQMPPQQIPAQQVPSQRMPAQQVPSHQMPPQQVSPQQLPQQVSKVPVDAMKQQQPPGFGPGQLPDARQPPDQLPRQIPVHEQPGFTKNLSYPTPAANNIGTKQASYALTPQQQQHQQHQHQHRGGYAGVHEDLWDDVDVNIDRRRGQRIPAEDQDAGRPMQAARGKQRVAWQDDQHLAAWAGTPQQQQQQQQQQGKMYGSDAEEAAAFALRQCGLPPAGRAGSPPDSRPADSHLPPWQVQDRPAAPTPPLAPATSAAGYRVPVTGNEQVERVNMTADRPSSTASSIQIPPVHNRLQPPADTYHSTMQPLPTHNRPSFAAAGTGSSNVMVPNHHYQDQQAQSLSHEHSTDLHTGTYDLNTLNCLAAPQHQPLHPAATGGYGAVRNYPNAAAIPVGRETSAPGVQQHIGPGQRLQHWQQQQQHSSVPRYGSGRQANDDHLQSYHEPYTSRVQGPSAGFGEADEAVHIPVLGEDHPPSPHHPSHSCHPFHPAAPAAAAARHPLPAPADRSASAWASMQPSSAATTQPATRHGRATTEYSHILPETYGHGQTGQTAPVSVSVQGGATLDYPQTEPRYFQAHPAAARPTTLPNENMYYEQAHHSHMQPTTAHSHLLPVAGQHVPYAGQAAGQQKQQPLQQPVSMQPTDTWPPISNTTMHRATLHVPSTAGQSFVPLSAAPNLSANATSVQMLHSRGNDVSQRGVMEAGKGISAAVAHHHPRWQAGQAAGPANYPPVHQPPTVPAARSALPNRTAQAGAQSARAIPVTSLAIGKPHPSASSLDIIAKVQQPASLWVTTNQAPGGVSHAGSFRQRRVSFA